MKAKNPKQHGFYFEKHEFGQSLQNYDFDRSHLEILHPFVAYNEYLIQTETTWLKKSSFDCFEDNSLKITDCIDNFISEKMGCRLPWVKSTRRMKLNECSGTEKLKEFRNVSSSITSEKSKKALKRRGCLTPNCKKITWRRSANTESWYTHHNGTEMNIYVPFSAKVVRKQEIKLADFSTFLADCGSYLGLFLGASILSITDVLLSCFKR